MAYTLKTGTIPDKVTALIMYDPTIGEIVDLGDKGGTTANGGIIESTGGPTWPTSASGVWGQGFFKPAEDVFDPTYFEFTNSGTDYRPVICSDLFGAGTTVLMIVNKLPTGEGVPENQLIWRNAGTGGVGLYFSTTDKFFGVKRDGDPSIILSSTALPSNTPFAVAATMQRSASTNYQLFYTTKDDSNFTSIAGPSSNNSDGGNSTLYRLGATGDGSSTELDIYMFVIFDGSLMTESELDTIIADPLGVLVNTGGGPITDGPKLQLVRGNLRLN